MKQSQSLDVRRARCLATAFVAVASVGSAHAYEWQLSENAMFGIGGDIEIAYAVEDKGDHHERDLFDNGSEIDVFGEYAFGRDMRVYFEAQFEYAWEEDGDPLFEHDDVYAGISSERFGTLQIGDWNGIYDDRIDDLLDVFEVDEAGGSSGDYRTESGDAIAYISPSFNGFSFAVQGFFKDVDGDFPGSDSEAFQATVQYENDHFGLYAGVDDNGTDPGADATIGLGASINLDPFTLAAKFETFGGDSSPDKACDDEYCRYEQQGLRMYGLAVIYDYGPGIIQAVVNQVEPRAADLDSRTAYGLYANYEFTDDFYVYIEHVGQGFADHDDDYTATGLVFEF